MHPLRNSRSNLSVPAAAAAASSSSEATTTTTGSAAIIPEASSPSNMTNATTKEHPSSDSSSHVVSSRDDENPSHTMMNATAREQKGIPPSVRDSSETTLVMEDGSQAAGAEDERQGPCGATQESPKKRQRRMEADGTVAEKTGPQQHPLPPDADAAGADAATLLSVPSVDATTTSTSGSWTSPSSVMTDPERQGRPRQRRRCNVSWGDDNENQTYEHVNPSASFRDYNQKDIWYTVRLVIKQC
jgi:hypothetical protein